MHPFRRSGPGFELFSGEASPVGLVSRRKGCLHVIPPFRPRKDFLCGFEAQRALRWLPLAIVWNRLAPSLGLCSCQLPGSETLMHRDLVGVEFNAVNQEHSNYRHQVLLYSGSRPLSQAKLWCSAALRFRGAKARLRNLTVGTCHF